jgi:hypothetical protein
MIQNCRTVPTKPNVFTVTTTWRSNCNSVKELVLAVELWQVHNDGERIERAMNVRSVVGSTTCTVGKVARLACCDEKATLLSAVDVVLNIQQYKIQQRTKSFSHAGQRAARFIATSHNTLGYLYVNQNSFTNSCSSSHKTWFYRYCWAFCSSCTVQQARRSTAPVRWHPKHARGICSRMKQATPIRRTLVGSGCEFLPSDQTMMPAGAWRTLALQASPRSGYTRSMNGSLSPLTLTCSCKLVPVHVNL